MSDAPSAAYLRVQTMAVPVADLDRSLVLYEKKLGFQILHQMLSPAGVRVALVAPSDGTAMLILAESAADPRLGTPTGVTFLTDDVDARHREWSGRGVQFSEAPRALPWAARVATFLDVDR